MSNYFEEYFKDPQWSPSVSEGNKSVNPFSQHLSSSSVPPSHSSPTSPACEKPDHDLCATQQDHPPSPTPEPQPAESCPPISQEPLSPTESVQLQLQGKQGFACQIWQKLPPQQSIPKFKQELKKLSPKSYKILPLHLKKFLVQMTETLSTSEVARLYQVSLNNLCRWKKSCSRRSGAGRKVTDSNMEEKLLEWIRSARDKGEYLSKAAIQKQALLLSKNPTFKASKGWYERFYRRNYHLGLDLPLVNSNR